MDHRPKVATALEGRYPLAVLRWRRDFATKPALDVRMGSEELTCPGEQMHRRCAGCGQRRYFLAAGLLSQLAEHHLESSFSRRGLRRGTANPFGASAIDQGHGHREGGLRAPGRHRAG